MKGKKRTSHSSQCSHNSRCGYSFEKARREAHGNRWVKSVMGSAKREAQPLGAGLRGDQRSERSWRKKRLSLLPEER